MSVTLSLFAGAGAQFFDDNGNPLSGGKIYTYAAGTTTPAVTYTTKSDSSFHTNPIVLDAAGRVSGSGEIWLPVGVGYKFVVKTSTDVLIATYDNIPSAAQPPAANDADSIMYEQGYTVSAGSFVIGETYRILTVGTTDFTQIGALSNTIGVHFIATGVGSGTGTAEFSRTVEQKLQENVSVKDFGAIGDGVADDAVAINLAVAYVNSIGGGGVYIPAGTYRITEPIHLDNFNILTHLYNSLTEPSRNINVFGDGPGATVIKPDGFWVSAFTTFPDPYLNVGNVPLKSVVKYKAENIHVSNLTIDMNYDVNPDGGTAYGPFYASWGGTWPNGATGASTWAADNYQFPFYMERVFDFSIINVEVKNSWYNGVESYMSEKGVISNNTFTNVCDKANYLGNYCVFEPDAGSRSIVFSNNICYSIGNGVVANGDPLSYVDNAVENIVIANNVFEDCVANGMNIQGWLNNWSITGNVFSLIQYNGILIEGNTGAPVAGRHPENMLINSNIIDEFGLANDVSIGIQANIVSGEICGNKIKQFFNTSASVNVFAIIAKNDGITLPGDDAFGVTISGNDIMGYFKATSIQNGIISCNIPNSLITGNKINRTAGATGSHICIYGNVIKTAGNMFLGAFSGPAPIYVDMTYAPYTNVLSDESGPNFSATIPAQVVGTAGSFNLLPFTTVEHSLYINNNGSYTEIGAFPGVYNITANVVINSTAGGCNVIIENSAGTILGQFLSSSFASGTVSVSAVVKANQYDYFRVKVYHANAYTVETTSRLVVSKT